METPIQFDCCAAFESQKFHPWRPVSGIAARAGGWIELQAVGVQMQRAHGKLCLRWARQFGQRSVRQNHWLDSDPHSLLLGG